MATAANSANGSGIVVVAKINKKKGTKAFPKNPARTNWLNSILEFQQRIKITIAHKSIEIVIDKMFCIIIIFSFLLIASKYLMVSIYKMPFLLLLSKVFL